jgi:hypothetical protein
MPPAGGIKDPEDRKALLELAKEFQSAADKALKHEGENTEDRLNGQAGLGGR